MVSHLPIAVVRYLREINIRKEDLWWFLYHRLHSHGHFSPLLQCLCEAAHDGRRMCWREAAHFMAAEKTGVGRETDRQKQGDREYRERQKGRDGEREEEKWKGEKKWGISTNKTPFKSCPINPLPPWRSLLHTISSFEIILTFSTDEALVDTLELSSTRKVDWLTSMASFRIHGEIIGKISIIDRGGVEKNNW